MTLLMISSALCAGWVGAMWVRHYPSAPAKSKGRLSTAHFLCCRPVSLKSKLGRAGGSGGPWWEQGWVQAVVLPCSGDSRHCWGRAGPELALLPLPAGTSLPPLLPQPCTIQHLVTHYLDISCVPRRSFFELLAFFSTDELEREKLQEFSSAQGQEELHSYCSRPRRTTLEVRLQQGTPAPPGHPGHRQPLAEEFHQLHPRSEVSVHFCWHLRAALGPGGLSGGLCPALGAVLGAQRCPGCCLWPRAVWDTLRAAQGHQGVTLGSPGLALLALQALWDFPHTTSAIPADYLLDLIPRIRPRAFSIASSLLVRAQPLWPRFRL